MDFWFSRMTTFSEVGHRAIWNDSARPGKTLLGLKRGSASCGTCPGPGFRHANTVFPSVVLLPYCRCWLLSAWLDQIRLSPLPIKVHHIPISDSTMNVRACLACWAKSYKVRDGATDPKSPPEDTHISPRCRACRWSLPSPSASRTIGGLNSRSDVLP